MNSNQAIACANVVAIDDHVCYSLSFSLLFFAKAIFRLYEVCTSVQVQRLQLQGAAENLYLVVALGGPGQR